MLLAGFKPMTSKPLGAWSSTHRDFRVSIKTFLALPMHRTLINVTNFRLCTTGSSSPSTRSPTRWTCRCRWTCRSRATSTAPAPSRPLSAPKSLPMRSRNCGNFQSNFTSRGQNTEAAFINPFTKQPWVRFSAFPRILYFWSCWDFSRALLRVKSNYQVIGQL